MGRNMGGRVIPYAEKNGVDFYKGPTPSWVPRELQRIAQNTLNRIDMAFNKQWINNEVSSGSRIVDISEPPGMPPIDFYNMELNQL